ncbi:MAG TPA: ORF6N domain-containing protein, partial [Nitrospirota bacterium]
MDTSIIPTERIEQSILVIRGKRVMLDIHLAEIYGVTTKRLNQQVGRNLDRFPEDFMFQLTQDEFETLRLQFATTNFTMRRN